MVGIIDYGLGNILAFANVYKRVSLPFRFVRTPQDLLGVEKLILPGVGSFDHAVSKLKNSGLLPDIEEAVLVRQAPVLGVCVGMHMLATRSEEGELAGLGWIPAAVKRLPGAGSADGGRLQLPHMGWNQVRCEFEEPLFKALGHDPSFYFLHSFFFSPDQANTAIAHAEYGREFCCAVRQGNIYGVQFHPEKSHQFGATLLKNFALM